MVLSKTKIFCKHNICQIPLFDHMGWCVCWKCVICGKLFTNKNLPNYNERKRMIKIMKCPDCGSEHYHIYPKGDQKLHYCYNCRFQMLKIGNL